LFSANRYVNDFRQLLKTASFLTVSVYSCRVRLCDSLLLTVRSKMTVHYYYLGKKWVWKKLEEN